MGLIKITYVLIVGFVLSFFVRTAGTLFPVIFVNPYVVRGTVFVHMLFIVMQCLFYVYFLYDYSAQREPALKLGSVLGILGSVLVAFIYFRRLCFVFGLDMIPVPLRNPFFDALVPTASSLCTLLFFSLFKKVQSREEHEALNRPITFALIGVGLFMVLHLIALLNFMKWDKFNGVELLSRVVAVGTLPFILLAAVSILYFYLRFYRFLTLKTVKRTR